MPSLNDVRTQHKTIPSRAGRAAAIQQKVEREKGSPSNSGNHSLGKGKSKGNEDIRKTRKMDRVLTASNYMLYKYKKERNSRTEI